MILERYIQVVSVTTTKKTKDSFISKINEGDLLHFTWKVETPSRSFAPRINVHNISTNEKYRVTPSSISILENRFKLKERKVLPDETNG